MSTHSKLGTGDLFPEMRLSIAGGQDIVLSNDIETDFAIVLFYRGHW